MPGTVNWGTATVVGIFAGMFYGGTKEASGSVVSMHIISISVLMYHLLRLEYHKVFLKE